MAALFVSELFQFVDMSDTWFEKVIPSLSI